MLNKRHGSETKKFGLLPFSSDLKHLPHLIAMDQVPETSLFTAVTASCLLGLSYVLSLYIWSLPWQTSSSSSSSSSSSDGKSFLQDRDHPSTIKRRFVSAFCMLFVSPPFVVAFGTRALLDAPGATLASVIGFRSEGMISAVVIPLFLTAALFLGPLVMASVNDVRIKLIMMPHYWAQSMRDLIWWRNYVVAPFTEEYTFRACMLPILLGYFTPVGSIAISPFFFGIAHLHHMIERIRKGQDIQTAVMISLFQSTYTTIFGMYSAFLFVRTGHIAAPVVAHGFCNFMGFPDFNELLNHPPRTRAILSAFFLLGVLLFFVLLFPLTDPKIYGNHLYKW